MRNDSWDETQIDRLERTIADRFQMLCIRLGHGMCTIGSASCVCCVVLYVCLMNAQYSIYIYIVCWRHSLLFVAQNGLWNIYRHDVDVLSCLCVGICARGGQRTREIGGGA